MENEFETVFDYFIGKVCSIYTRQINWKLENEQTMDYFVGIINSINKHGICLTNIVNDKKTLIMMSAVVAIAEESYGAGNKQAFEFAQKNYEEKKQEVFNLKEKTIPDPIKKPITKINDSPFVDIKQMTAYANEAKKKYSNAK